MGISNLLVAVLMARRPERDECSSRATAVLGRSKRLLIKTLSEAFEDNSDLEVIGRLDNSTEEDFEEKLRTSESEESLPYPASTDALMLHQETKLSRLLVEKYSNVDCCLARRCDHCFTRQETIGQGSNRKRELDTFAVRIAVSKCISCKKNCNINHLLLL
jgi:hypothetical protein